MKLTLFIAGSLLLLMAAINAAAQSAPDSTFELYILMGQSNMAGRGPLTSELQVMGNDSLLMLTREKQWVKAKHPLHFDKPAIAGVGPGLSFGMAMLQGRPGIKIGLVPCAVGGTAIEKWLPGAFDSATNTHPYDDALDRITYAMRFGIIKGIIWHQGEANSQPGQASNYLLQLTQLINRIRNIAGNSSLPFVAGELGYFISTHDNINQQLAVLPKLVAHTGIATAQDLTDKGDHLHFDAASAATLGNRYAAQMIILQKK